MDGETGKMWSVEQNLLPQHDGVRRCGGIGLVSHVLTSAVDRV